jgi:hypothetical protein
MARRSFLLGCGGSAALLLPILRSMEARAGGTPAPLRLFILHHPLGAQLTGSTNPDLWRPAATATTTNFTLPFESAPFAPLQSLMVMIDGLNIVTATKATNLGTASGQNTHEGGLVALMTGVPSLGRIGQQDWAAGGPSIDQILLAQSPVLGGPASPAASQTPFGSLQLAADIRSDRDEVAPRVMSYLAPNPMQTDISVARRPLYAETQPINVYNRIFGGAMAGSASNAAQILAQKKSVLDFMRADLARLRTLAPSSEKVRLDAQTDAIRQLEATISASLGQPMTTATCTTPMMPETFAQSGMGASGSLAPKDASGNPITSMLSGVDYYDPTNPNNHPHQRLGQAQLSLIRAAFACDLVRVATFQWSAGTNWVVFPGTYGGATIKGSPVSTPHHPPSHSPDAQTMGWLSQVNAFYSTQTAQALQQFQATMDVDGNNLLDNTIVVYVTEVARAWDHDQRNMPLLVFGGKNTGVKGGTFLKATGGSLPSIDGGSTNRPTNDLWLAVAAAFGVNLTQLGAPTQYTGPLAGIFG